MQDIDTKNMPREQIRQMRENMGLTKEELGELLGLSERAIRDREHGRAAIRAEMFYAVQYIYNRAEQRQKLVTQRCAKRAELSSIRVAKEYGLYLN